MVARPHLRQVLCVVRAQTSIFCARISNLKKKNKINNWLADKQSSSNIRISHAVTNYEFLYEPFYVSLDNVPPHDERFVGYGFTRNTQVYEMYVAGYTFYVLTPAFTCHWGLQLKKDRPAWREQQNNLNRKRFETFKGEIIARYKTNKMNLKNKRLRR